MVLDTEETPFASVETFENARKRTALSLQRKVETEDAQHSLPSFSDGRAVADTLRMAGPDVPTLVCALPDELGKMKVQNRRDSFCGKMSVCNSSEQYGVAFTLI